jgi:abhydrolase domain-containing protein 6
MGGHMGFGRKFAFLGLIALSVPISSWLIVARVWPEQTAGGLLSAYASLSGLEKKTVQTRFGTVHYFEGGTGPETVVLLHGIFARKEHWIDFSRRLTSGYRVIVPDLPGFGENPPLGQGEYRYRRQAENVMTAIDAMGIDEFHLAANSMGGQIAGLLAINAADRITSVAFIGSPVGVDIPRESPFQTAMRDEGYTLVVASPSEFDRRNTFLFPRKPFVPEVIESHWARSEIARTDTNLRIWREVNESNSRPLQEIAAEMTMPSLVVWCAEDMIFDVSGAEVLAETLPESTLVTLEGCGHVPSIDSPVAAGQALRTFLDGLEPH